MAERILIVEDERHLNDLLRMELEDEGYTTGCAFDGRAGLEMALSGEYDLVLLDIMLPELNGLEVLRRVRRKDEALPIIMVTALDTTMDRVTGLDSGADDYITKPFDIEEVLARIRVALRRRPAMPTHGGRRAVQGVVIDPDSRTVTVDGREVSLSKTEFDLLYCLMDNRGKVMDRDTITNIVWGYAFMGETNNVDVVITHLRKRLGKEVGNKLIETVRGVGYVVR